MTSSRYHKQMLFAGIGRDGQQRLAESRVLLVGCGALGCVLADTMVRAGVGSVRIVDRDFVELSNLQRQILFDEQDVAKSWSFFDFITKKEGKRGQQFLRAACEFSMDKATFLQKWRAKSNTIYEVKDGDVFKAIDERWRAFAETGQETGETARRKG